MEQCWYVTELLMWNLRWKLNMNYVTQVNSYFVNRSNMSVAVTVGHPPLTSKTSFCPFMLVVVVTFCFFGPVHERRERIPLVVLTGSPQEDDCKQDDAEEQLPIGDVHPDLAPVLETLRNLHQSSEFASENMAYPQQSGKPNLRKNIDILS